MFRRCKNLADCKELFRRLAKYLHPDTGGEADLFIILQEEYEMVQEFFKILEKEDKKNKQSDLKYKNSYENIIMGDDRLEIIDEILTYASNHPKFDRSFIESVKEFMLENGHITSGQFNCLVKVYYNFRMDKKND